MGGDVDLFLLCINEYIRKTGENLKEGLKKERTTLLA